MNEFEQMQTLKDFLTKRIVNTSKERLEIKDNELKEEFSKLVSRVSAEDELWEWEWFDEPRGQGGYSLGWCIVRGEEVIESYCHSFS